MKRSLGIVLLLWQLTLVGCAGASAGDFELVFTQREIQDMVKDMPKSAVLVEGWATVSLNGNPVIELGAHPNRVGVSARLWLQVPGAKPMPASLSGSARLRYSEPEKAFYLEAMQVETVEAPVLPKLLEAPTKSALAQYLNKTYTVKPVYVLREHGNQKERAVRQLLKSVTIRPGEVVAKFSVLPN